MRVKKGWEMKDQLTVTNLGNFANRFLKTLNLEIDNSIVI